MIKRWRERRRWRQWVKANQDRIGLWQITDRSPQWDGPRAGVDPFDTPPAVQRYRRWSQYRGHR